MNITKDLKFMRVSNAAAAATTAITSSAIDTKGFETVTIAVAMGAITSGAVTSVKAQQSSDDGSADAYSDLEGTSQSIADDADNNIVLLEIDNPRKRYLKAVITRGTQNAVVDGIFAILGKPKIAPVTQDATVESTEYHHAPAEGTA